MRDPEAKAQAILDLDRLVHEPARLAILTVLSAAADVEFQFLQRVTGLSKGNLSSHAQKLEAADYVEILKSFRGRVPLTTLRLTKAGRQALQAYERQLRALVGR